MPQDWARLESWLNQSPIKTKDNPLYQAILNLIRATKQFQADITAQVQQLSQINLIINGIVPGAGLESRVIALETQMAAVNAYIVNAEQHVRVILNNGQIKALPGTDIGLLIPVIVGYRPIFKKASLYIDTTSGAYTNINANPSIFIQYTGGTQVSNKLIDDGAATPVAITDVTDFLTGNINTVDLDKYTRVTDPTLSEEGNLADTLGNFDGEGFELSMNNGGSGNLTGGDPANILIVDLYYNQVPVTP